MAGESPEYLRWVREQLCAAQPCAARDIQASHPRTSGGSGRLGGKPGKGQRALDTAAYPLCVRHHGAAQRYEFSRGFFACWDMSQFAAWESKQGADHYARYLEEQEQLRNGTLPEEKLVKALRRQGFDPHEFAQRFCREYELGEQVALVLGRDLKRELKEGGVPL